MSVVILGGNECMERRYKDLCGAYSCQAKVFTKPAGGLKNKLGNPDLILLPGSKNTMGDLVWMRECGLESRLLQLAASGVPLMGICGGFQMLGREISDPEHVEAGGSMRGMGLLPMRTVFEGNKVRQQVSDVTGPLQGIWKEISGMPYEGYEIHMGRSIWEEETGYEKTTVVSRDNICGTYVHGIFDSKEMQQAVIGMLLHRKGLEPGEGLFMDQKDYKEQQFDILADGLRSNMDMDMVYRILNGV